jgi:hypothetical protein
MNGVRVFRCVRLPGIFGLIRVMVLKIDLLVSVRVLRDNMN